MGFITISLKLYKPSKVKKSIMDNALGNYSRAFDFVVDKGFDSLDILEKLSQEKNPQTKISRWCSQRFGKELNYFNIEPFKDSIIIDFATFILGFLAMKKRKPQMDKPSAFTGEMEVERYRPIYFCRTSPKRDFSILYDEERERFYLKLYLLNRNSELKRMQTSQDNGLVYIHTAGGSLTATGKADRFIIVPLAFGKWQEGYLKMAMKNPAMIKTGRMKKNNKEYFFDINMEIDYPKAYKPIAYFSITRGVMEPLNYAVVDVNHKIIEEGPLIKKEELSGDNSYQFLFQIAKRICEMALKNQAAVVVEKLDYRSDYLNFTDKKENFYGSAFSKEQYRKLVNILRYKVPSRGCGRIFELSPLDIFHRCPVCSMCSRKSRFGPELFICTSCATSMEVDKLGSINLARKLLKYAEGKIQIKSKIEGDGIIFINTELDFKLVCKLGRIDYTELVAAGLKQLAENFDSWNIPKKKLSLLMKIKSNSELTKLIQIL